MNLQNPTFGTSLPENALHLDVPDVRCNFSESGSTAIVATDVRNMWNTENPIFMMVVT